MKPDTQWTRKQPHHRLAAPTMTPTKPTTKTNPHAALVAQLHNQSAVAADLLRAIQPLDQHSTTTTATTTASNCNSSAGVIDEDDWFHDVNLIAAGGAVVPACRFVLAARSTVFRRMLYGSFREAKSSSIALLGYAEPILKAIVYFCHTNALDPTFCNCSYNNNNSTSSGTAATRSRTVESSVAALVDTVQQLLHLSQAADYLQLTGLQSQLEHDWILPVLARHPAAVCTSILQEAGLGSRMAQAAMHMIECRPYITLEGEAVDSNTTSSTSNNEDTDMVHRSNCHGGITLLSAEKLECVLKNSSIGCSEWFIFRQLSRWYQHQRLEILLQHQQQEAESQEDKNHPASIVANESSNSTTTNSTPKHAEAAEEALLSVTRDLCFRYIRLQNIEPSLLLASHVPWITPQAIFEAVSHQALQASHHGVWRLQYRGGGTTATIPAASTDASSSIASSKPAGTSPDSASDASVPPVAINTSNSINSKQRVDRVLVEGSGSREVDGMYYRIAHGWLSNESDLYTKREVAVGQQYVYTISRCLRNNNLPSTTSFTLDGADMLEGTTAGFPYYECRIFGSKFLTHNAIQSLRTMQSTASIAPCFQPVLQVLEITPPASPSSPGTTPNANSTANAALPFNNGNVLDTAALAASLAAASTNPLSAVVPRPIRKYYRVRLSDGDYHMPGTLAPELNALLENGNLNERNVLRVLEFGVYTIYGCAGIHILRAVVVTTTPSYVFGEPVALEDVPALPPNMASNATERNESPIFLDECTATDDHLTALIRTDTRSSAAFQQQQQPQQDSGLQNLYTHRCSIQDDEANSRIPKSGWRVDSHGMEPAPVCTWIPAGPAPSSHSLSSLRSSSSNGTGNTKARSGAGSVSTSLSIRSDNNNNASTPRPLEHINF